MLKDYKPLKMPDELSEGFLFSIAKNKQLDVFGKWENMQRRKFLFMKEPSFLYRIRLRNKGIIDAHNRRSR